MPSYQYVYVMNHLTKAYPGVGEVLKDITLAFLPGAKIGVLGYNGAGKSTLLRIMAGIDTEFNGEAWAAEGATVGYLPQEPPLDPKKDVKGNVLEGLGETHALLQRFEEVSAKFAEPMDDDEMNELLAEQADLQDKIDAADAWDLDRTVEIAMDALRLPPGDADVGKLSGGERRRVALCRLLLQKPDLLLLDEPTNHLDAESVAWLERFLHEYAGTVVAVTHDRYFLDNVAGWILELDRGRGIPWKGNYSSWLEQKEKRLAQEERTETARQRTLGARARMGARDRRARGRPRARPASTPTRSCWPSANARSVETAQIIIPPGPRLGELVIEAERLTQGLRRHAADRGSVVQAAARRHRRHHRAERRRQDHAVPHDHRAGKARCRHVADRRHGEARLRRSVARDARTRRRRCGRKSPAATTSWCSASAR